MKLDELNELFLGIYKYKQETNSVHNHQSETILWTVNYTVIIHAIAMTHANLKYIPNCMLIVFTIAPLILGLQFPMKPKLSKVLSKKTSVEWVILYCDFCIFVLAFIIIIILGHDGSIPTYGVSLDCVSFVYRIFKVSIACP